jgi:hypothetical protein
VPAVVDRHGSASSVGRAAIKSLSSSCDIVSWQFDTVLNIGSETGTDLTLRYIPNGDDED